MKPPFRSLRSNVALLLTACALVACDEDPGADAGPADAGLLDASSGDGGGSDAGDDAGVTPPGGGTRATTTSGDVLGSESDGVITFRSIPYAAPPVGDLRFARPVPHPGWTEALDTTTTDPTIACPQLERTGGAMRGQEDCLVLNVYSPSGARDRPVMVFVHGGGFTGGSANEPLYQGHRLASRDVVLVTINYRLGVLGFLAAPGLVEPDGGAGNLGLWDQRLALQWIRDNAAAFGGDPDNVTIFGESAGAVSVMSHMVSAQSAGLFERVIIESGGGGLSTPTQAEVFTRYQPILESLGCASAADLRACLRALDYEAILATTNDAGMSALGLPAIGPHLDGVFLAEDPIDTVARGGGDVPFLIGSNADEATVFTQGVAVPTRAAFRALLLSLYPAATADAVLGIYDASLGTPKQQFNAFFGESGFVCPTLAMAAAGSGGEPARVYHFTRVLPGVAGLLGSFHGLELPYVFGTTDVTPGYTPDAADAALVETMQRAWVGFATDGVPVFDPGWAPYAAADPAIAILDEPPAAATEIVAGRCAQLAALGIGVP